MHIRTLLPFPHKKKLEQRFFVDVVHIPFKRHFSHILSVLSCRTSSPILSPLISNHTANTQSISLRCARRRTGLALAIVKPWDRHRGQGWTSFYSNNIDILINKPFVWRRLKTPSEREAGLPVMGVNQFQRPAGQVICGTVCGFLLTFSINKFCHFLGSPVAVLTWRLSIL